MKRERERPEVVEECPECGSSHIQKDDSRAELVCQDCGLVIDDNLMDRGPDWRAFDREQRDKRAHTGPPMTPLKHDRGLSTEIGWGDRDSYGQSIPTRSRSQLYRMRKWHRRVRVSGASERNLAIALQELDRMSSSMGLPRTVREVAAVIYRKAVAQNLIRGRSIEVTVAATLYAACRECDFPRALSEMVVATKNISRKEIGRNYRFLKRELKLKEGPSSPKAYIPRFCSELKISDLEIQKKAIEIVEKSDEKGLNTGTSPPGTAAAAIYIAILIFPGWNRITQRDISIVSGVTEVTIRNRYRLLINKLDIDITLP